MNPDNLKKIWNTEMSQPRLTLNADQLFNEASRKEREFNAMIFWRDVREVGTCLVMIPLWIVLGRMAGLPWTWYLAIPALLWVAGYMFVSRMRHMRRQPEPSEPLRQHVENSLKQVEFQIRLLRNVFWWYLLPLALPILAFCAQIAWRDQARGWGMAIVASITAVVIALAFAWVYRLNQLAVRASLEPRRQELETLLKSLDDEQPNAS